MSLLLLIVFGIPALALLGQIAGGVIGFVVTLAFHGLRAFLRYIVVAGIRQIFPKKESHEPSL